MREFEEEQMILQMPIFRLPPEEEDENSSEEEKELASQFLSLTNVFAHFHDMT